MPPVPRLRFGLALASLALACSAVARAADASWRASLEEGLTAAKTSGKAVLVVTLWKTGV